MNLIFHTTFLITISSGASVGTVSNGSSDDDDSQKKTKKSLPTTKKTCMTSNSLIVGSDDYYESTEKKGKRKWNDGYVLLIDGEELHSCCNCKDDWYYLPDNLDIYMKIKSNGILSIRKKKKKKKKSSTDDDADVGSSSQLIWKSNNICDISTIKDSYVMLKHDGNLIIRGFCSNSDNNNNNRKSSSNCVNDNNDSTITIWKSNVVDKPNSNYFVGLTKNLKYLQIWKGTPSKPKRKLLSIKTHYNNDSNKKNDKDDDGDDKDNDEDFGNNKEEEEEEQPLLSISPTRKKVETEILLTPTQKPTAEIIVDSPTLLPSSVNDDGNNNNENGPLLPPLPTYKPNMKTRKPTTTIISQPSPTTTTVLPANILLQPSPIPTTTMVMTPSAVPVQQQQQPTMKPNVKTRKPTSIS